MAKKPAGYKPYSPVNAALTRSLPTAVRGAAPRRALRPEESEPGEVVSIREAQPPEILSTEGVSRSKTAVEEPVDEEPRPRSEYLTKTIRTPISLRENQELRQLVNSIGVALESSTAWANVGRALTILLRNAEDEVMKQCRRHGHLKRPPNNEAAAVADYDQRIAMILDRAFRNAAPVEKEG